VTSVFKILKN